MNYKNIMMMVALQCIVPLCGMHSQEKKEQQYIISRIKNSVSIYDPARQSEVVVFKRCVNAIVPGVYYRTLEGLKPMPNNLKSNDGVSVVHDHLSHLALTRCVRKKMNSRFDDGTHNFSTLVEKGCGNWARVVVHNNIHHPEQIKESDKKFHLYITLPGVINIIGHTKAGKRKIVEQKKGVFEFTVRKTLYEQEGLCHHRFFSRKGTVGADSFGVKG